MVSWYHPNRQLRSANTTSLVPHLHKSILHGRRLMDTGAAVLQLQYYGIICHTPLNVHRPYIYSKTFLNNSLLKFTYFTLCSTNVLS